jgi:hypothetical protein
MRYVLAGGLAALVICAMFAFSYAMGRQVEVWGQQHATLADYEMTAITVARWWTHYWYAGSAVIIAACIGAAALVSRQ